MAVVPIKGCAKPIIGINPLEKQDLHFTDIFNTKLDLNHPLQNFPPLFCADYTECPRVILCYGRSYNSIMLCIMLRFLFSEFVTNRFWHDLIPFWKQIFLTALANGRSFLFLQVSVMANVQSTMCCSELLIIKIIYVQPSILKSSKPSTNVIQQYVKHNIGNGI